MLPRGVDLRKATSATYLDLLTVVSSLRWAAGEWRLLVGHPAVKAAPRQQQWRMPNHKMVLLLTRLLLKAAKSPVTPYRLTDVLEHKLSQSAVRKAASPPPYLQLAALAYEPAAFCSGATSAPGTSLLKFFRDANVQTLGNPGPTEVSYVVFESASEFELTVWKAFMHVPNFKNSSNLLEHISRVYVGQLERNTLERFTVYTPQKNTKYFETCDGITRVGHTENPRKRGRLSLYLQMSPKADKISANELHQAVLGSFWDLTASFN
ncbi:hypothetical protein UY3_17908 [Chelonia mydas]|uniref:Uncharacterized protein n=1 Tax=Chelonia mydas TaxID=8469 RepID=M7B9W2_CHEMY|nr:hypothetical protein UY3_17908 [Chelonia mydas]